MINTITNGNIEKLVQNSYKERKEEFLDGKNEDYIEIDEEFYNLFKGANTFNCFLFIKRQFFLHVYF